MAEQRQVVDYPEEATGVFCQGDIVIWRLPRDIEVDKTQKINERDGRIVISEGEIIGHFHAINLMGGSAVHRFRDDGIGQALENQVLSKEGNASLYADMYATQELVRRGVLQTTNQCIGYLIVQDGYVVLGHPEHDGVRLPKGRYYVGSQSESIAGEMRRVQD